jgi:uncharacterized protein with HEPN domain
MVDKDLIIAKASSVKRHLNRIHEYGKVELKQVFEVAKKEIEDLEKYFLSIFSKLGLKYEK